MCFPPAKPTSPPEAEATQGPRSPPRASAPHSDAAGAESQQGATTLHLRDSGARCDDARDVKWAPMARIARAGERQLVRSREATSKRGPRSGGSCVRSTPYRHPRASGDSRQSAEVRNASRRVRRRDARPGNRCPGLPRSNSQLAAPCALGLRPWGTSVKVRPS